MIGYVKSPCWSQKHSILFYVRCMRRHKKGILLIESGIESCTQCKLVRGKFAHLFLLFSSSSWSHNETSHAAHKMLWKSLEGDENFTPKDCTKSSSSRKRGRPWYARRMRPSSVLGLTEKNVDTIRMGWHFIAASEHCLGPAAKTLRSNVCPRFSPAAQTSVLFVTVLTDSFQNRSINAFERMRF